VTSQEPLNLVFLPSYPSRLVPVNLNKMSGAIGEPNFRNALPLSPTTLAIAARVLVFPTQLQTFQPEWSDQAT